MKMKKILCGAALLTLGFTLGSCGGPSVDKTVEGFDTTATGTAKIELLQNFKVDVNANGGTANMDSFKRDIESKVTVDLDLGSDLYVKIKKNTKDKRNNKETTLEAILYKKDGKYYQMTSTSLPVEVKDSDAKKTLNTLLQTYSEEQVGYITLDTLLYKLGKDYEFNNFGFSTSIEKDDLVEPSYKASKEGLTVTYKPEYFGYHTDGGWSDFSNADKGYAAEITLTTNEKGYVTSFNETLDGKLDFNIMTPAPTVSVTGSRVFSATYGETLTKADKVDLIKSTAKIADLSGGKALIMTCKMGDFNNMTPITNGAELALGNVICIKPTADPGKELEAVEVNGSTKTLIEPEKAGGFYCFDVIAGENTISVTFKDEAAPTVATVVITNDSNIEFSLVSFPFMGGTPTFTPVTDNTIEPGANIFGAIAVASNVAVTVTVNGTSTNPNIPGGANMYYCFAVKTAGTYNVVITPAA